MKDSRLPHWNGWHDPSPPSADRIGDLRERVARLETAERYAADRLQSHAERIRQAHDRLNWIDRTLAGATAALGEIRDLAVRLTRIEARGRALKEVGQYAVAGALLGLTASGRLTVEQLAAIARAFGLGS